jgi:hypothetical protein
MPRRKVSSVLISSTAVSGCRVLKWSEAGAGGRRRRKAQLQLFVVVHLQPGWAVAGVVQEEEEKGFMLEKMLH